MVRHKKTSWSWEWTPNPEFKQEVLFFFGMGEMVWKEAVGEGKKCIGTSQDFKHRGTLTSVLSGFIQSPTQENRLNSSGVSFRETVGSPDLNLASQHILSFLATVIGLGLRMWPMRSQWIRSQGCNHREWEVLFLLGEGIYQFVTVDGHLDIPIRKPTWE